MNIELRNVSINSRMSEETPCYSAKLCVNGKPVAIVQNRGHGGPDEVEVVNKIAFLLAQNHIENLPPIPSGYEGLGPLKMDVELWCHLQLEKVEEEKAIRASFRKDMKKTVSYIRDGKLFYTSFKGVKAVEKKHIDYVRQNKPDVIILNDMPEAEAYALYAAAIVKA